MIPSSRWFPTSWAERVLWYANFAAQFILVAESLGLADKIQQVKDDNIVMQFLGGAEMSVESYREAMRQFRKIITEGLIGTPTPDFPGNLLLALPKIVATGIFARLDKLRSQIMEADSYTDEIGALLGILTKKTDSISPEEKKPTLKGKTMPAQQIVVEFVRGTSDGVNLHIKVDGGAPLNIGNFYKSPAVFTVSGDASKPHEVEIIARYLDGNTPTGQNSDEIKLVSQT